MPNAPLLVTALTKWEPAGGPLNGQNLIFTTSKKFISGTLEVIVDSSWMDPGIDFEELPNFQGFQLILGNDSNQLKKAPVDDERIFVRYVQG